MRLSAAEREKILWRNAERVLRIDRGNAG